MMFFCQNTLRSQNSKQLLNQKGQISVFLALGFLVLFTMFGMTINIAMVVHDKIVLQNAADFASIYVAQRQAEQLNAIAHFNYQIRQAHKLLAYRYVVLGTAGIDSARRPDFSAGSETEDPYARKDRYPFCIADDKIMEFPGGNSDEFCNPRISVSGFSGIQPLEVINTSLGVNTGLREQTQRVVDALRYSAVNVSAINWWFVANSMASFKNQVSYRKSLIRALANNLARPVQIGANGMKDLSGESVYEGAQKTFEYNLSESIRRRGGYNIKIQNPLSGFNYKDWLPEIPVHIIPTYGEYNVTDPTTSRFSPVAHQYYYNYPTSYIGAEKIRIDNELFNFLNPGFFLKDMADATFPNDNDLEDILGFEKNPWYMVYNHVEVSASSGALFSPVPGTTLYAQAFSKPFGGQIGPWYSKDWPQGSPTSNGNKTEVLWPQRKIGSVSLPTSVDQTILPNAPKYPGDGFGFISKLAQSSVGPTGGIPKVNRFNINDYRDITLNLFPDRNGQALALGDAGLKESAAIAPDLFDITYYSIEPNFDENYLHEKLDRWLLDEAIFSRGFSYKQPIWRDFGYSTEPPATNQRVTVKDQLMVSHRQTYGGQIFYFLNSSNEGLANILTSWVGGTDVVDYRSPASGTVRDRFGKCPNFHPNTGPKPHIPGECLNGGGRTGYSVKMVSKEYLLSNQHQMSPNSTGAILNPPKDFSP